MSLCSVLRKVAAGTYIGGYLFYIYLGWLPNGTVTMAQIFLHYTISHMRGRIDEMMQFILYIVKNCVAVTIGTYIGCNLCYYSDIARNELKKHYFEL